MIDQATKVVLTGQVISALHDIREVVRELEEYHESEIWGDMASDACGELAALLRERVYRLEWLYGMLTGIEVHAL